VRDAADLKNFRRDTSESCRRGPWTGGGRYKGSTPIPWKHSRFRRLAYPDRACDGTCANLGLTTTVREVAEAVVP
jgi:hypothetical protein